MSILDFIDGKDNEEEKLLKKLEYINKVVAELNEHCGYVKKHDEKYKLRPSFDIFEIDMVMGCKASFEFSLN